MVWVDNFLALSTKEGLNNKIECDLNVHFKVKSLGLPNLLLRIKISIGDDFISLSQAHYINFLLDKYAMTDANPISTPMDPNVKFNMEVKSQAGTEVGELPETNHGYGQLIRSLMYLNLHQIQNPCTGQP